MQRLRTLLAALVILVLGIVPAHAQKQTPNIFAPYIQRVTVVSVPERPTDSFIDPPIVYKKWWLEVQKCTKLYAPISVFRKLKFEMIDADAFISGSDSTFLMVGLTNPWYNRITLVIGEVTSEQTVKHEMTHILMYQNGLQAGHPDSLFKKCKLVN